ncbi:MAG TPA: hypothetical protein VFQ07_13580 [Candidatus Polarisedimenticolia bacterium]|nr:hypothetical protein [Candidatus Polarisedimenticolia bacterium]
MLQAASLLLVAFAFASSSFEAGKPKDKEKEAEPGKPKLKLLAEPSVGFTPVSALLTANLTGVAPNDPNFCHPAVTWVRMNPGQTEDQATRTHEDPVCRHPESEARAATSFIRSYDLQQPGTYLFRVIVEGKNHTKVASGTAQVVVLRVQ